MNQKQITLYCAQGNSDKVYIIEKVPTEADFVVNFAYGRLDAEHGNENFRARRRRESRPDFRPTEKRKAQKGVLRGRTSKRLRLRDIGRKRR